MNLLSKVGLKMNTLTLLDSVQEGKCPECAVKHEPKLPHNRDSLFYQYKFYAQNGRWPTWKDAMAHCSNEMQKIWTAELLAKGVKIEGADK